MYLIHTYAGIYYLLNVNCSSADGLVRACTCSATVGLSREVFVVSIRNESGQDLWSQQL